MELYTFRCKKCKYVFKKYYPKNELPDPVCPKCGGKCVVLDFLTNVFHV